MMDDDFIYRLRPRPSPEFAARLKAKLDRQETPKSAQSWRSLRMLIIALLIGGAAFAAVAFSIRGFSDIFHDRGHSSEKSATYEDSPFATSHGIPPATPKTLTVPKASDARADNEVRPNTDDGSHPTTGQSGPQSMPEPNVAATYLPPTSHLRPTRYDGSGAISGAGATFPYPIYSKWADAYKGRTGIGLNYQAIGSGGGVQQIKAKSVTFGATDMPLRPDEVRKFGLVQFPSIIGGAVPVVNIGGVGAGRLTLDGATIASIFLGEIAKWNDTRIKRLNPKVALPDTAIAPVYRADGSGTNLLFSDYLSKSSVKFKDTIGAATSVQWPVGIGAKGDEGVANMVSQTDGAIGYVEYAYAKQNKMAYALMINRAGKVVAPSAASLQAAASNGDWAHAPGHYLILTDQTGAASWPICGATFVLMQNEPSETAARAQALAFFDWAFANGGKMAAELDYAPLPASVVQQVRESWKEWNAAPVLPHEP
jgi:phosphate transport system substrate-binding protein